MQPLRFTDLNLRRLRVGGRVGDAVIVVAKTPPARRRRGLLDFSALFVQGPVRLGGAAASGMAWEEEAVPGLMANLPSDPQSTASVADELGLDASEVPDLSDEGDMLRALYAALCDSGDSDNVGTLLELARGDDVIDPQERGRR